MSKSKSTPLPKDFKLETALAELETLAAKLEDGELPLETALTEFERGIALTRQCQQALEAAEQQVKILLQRDGESELADFDAPDE